MNLKKIITYVLAAGVLIGTAITIYLYNKAFTANTLFNSAEVYVTIPTATDYEQVKVLLKPYIKDFEKFEFVAESRAYSSNVVPGRFLLKKGMSSFSLVQALRRNVPVTLAFNNQESINKLAQRIASQLEIDSTTFIKTFTNPDFLKNNNLTEEDVLTFFIPNTYEFYWNIPPAKLVAKLEKEYRRFWNQDRKAKAAQKNLSPTQVSILASIVHKETAKIDERPTVAGVYLNRLVQNMPLQADPTVIFALKKQSGDFNQVIKRVYYNDLKINSPYNTYRVTGLPPGPIAMPDISAIDAVLNAQNHDYIYFCADPDKPGYHLFASSYEAHQVNAKKYADWVNALQIKR